MENTPKSENLATLTLCSSATVRLRKKLTDFGNSLTLGLQRGVNSISLQCIPWPVACSEWGACLTDFRFWGEMTPKMKSFANVFPDSATGHRTTFRVQIVENRPLRSCRNSSGLPQKNSGSAGLVPAPILPKMGQSRPKFPERCHPSPWHVHVHRIWSGSPASCRTYSGKIDFAAPKVIGFRQPTIRMPT